MRIIALASALLLATACGSTGFQGSVVDGLTGQPIPEFKMVAKADGEVGLTCMTFEATSGADGKFNMEGACVGESAYTLKPDNESWWLAETASVPQAIEGEHTVKAWRSGGKSANLYHLKSDGVKSVPTASDMTEETLLDTEEKVKYPKSVPGSVPLIAKGEYLVLNGKDYIEKTRIAPLIHSGPRNFGTKDEPVEISNAWWYIGVEFASDTEFTRKEAQIDESKAVTHEGPDKAVKWIPADAFAPGRYALWRDDGRRMYIVDFVEAPKVEERKEAPAE